MLLGFRYVILLLALCVYFIPTCFAQPDQSTLVIAKLNGKINIDGKVDEEVWSTIDPLPLTMHWPSFQGEITESTKIRLAYDDEYIYIGAICHDSKASEIQMPTFQRDAISQKADQIAFILDPYNDNENTLAFIVTAAGSRIDMTVKNDAQGSDATSTSWNSYWIAEATINENDWQTEMRIPFSSLRFQVENGKVEMGLIAYRYVARKRELNIFPAIPPNWGFLSFLKASQAQTISFDGIENKRPWYTSPYLLLGTGHHHEENDLGNLEKHNDNDLQVGLDVQHAFSDNLNVDFTINTDFAQVEADNQAVNLSRFSLFFPEKRRFFLERASTFDFKNEGSNNMFYSRRIGIQDGNMIPLYGGVRLVGRVDKLDVGLINMQSQAEGEYNSENFGVLRLRRNVINQRSYIGGMITSRMDTEGNNNFAYGIDGIINLFKQDYLQINLSQSQDTNDTTGINTMERSRIYMMWENRIVNGLGYRFSYSNVGEYYNPRLGFEQRFNFSQFGDQIFYSWFAPEASKLRQSTITLNGSASFNNTTNDLETHTIGLSGNWAWDRGNELGVNIENFHDNVPEAFDLSDEITITPNSYTNTSASISYDTAPVGLVNVGANARIGTFYGGELTSLSCYPEIVFSKYFQLSAFYQFNYITFPELNQTFKSHLARLNLGASAFVQLNSLDKISAINFRLRYNPVDGNDLYIVYNETINNDPLAHTPELPRSDNRAIMLKYIHTFHL